VKRLAASLCLALAAPAAGQGVGHWSAEIEEASTRFGVPQEWIRRVMEAESGGHTSLDGRLVTSRAGAMGLMQLMPGTWAEMRQAYGLGPDPYAPRDNILAGAAYLRLMYDRFGYPGLFAAYNAGPNRYAERLASGAALPAETVAYLQKVSGRRSAGSAVAASRTVAPAAPADVFAVRRVPPARAQAKAAPPGPDVLFAIQPTSSE
jgi:soluble lytic murein transglycosylase-like protein